MVSRALCLKTIVPWVRISQVQMVIHLRDVVVIPDNDLNLNDERCAQVGVASTKGQHSKVNAEELSHQWQIGLKMARDTLKATMQFSI